MFLYEGDSVIGLKSKKKAKGKKADNKNTSEQTEKTNSFVKPSTQCSERQKKNRRKKKKKDVNVDQDEIEDVEEDTNQHMSGRNNQNCRFTLFLFQLESIYQYI